MENRTLAKITPKERKEQRLWNAIALREAVINAFVHNDYTKEVAPKFEIFDDRLEITSYGSLPEGLSKEEFFEGYSIIRNKELMRIFKDLDLVEQLGSGIPRILQAYTQDCFHFSENFLRVTLPSTESVTQTQQDTQQDTQQVKELLKVFKGTHSRGELQEMLGLSDRENFRQKYLQPAIEAGLIALTIPDKPTSRNQKYYLTEKGKKTQ
uniref:Fic family protein n=1 Tax=Paenimyroides marinum TaxID=1159016 RepID=UPI0037C5E54B